MKHIKKFNETEKFFEKSNGLFKTQDFIEWLIKVSPDWITITDLDMYVDKYKEINNIKN
jgi:hypothetical protein